MISKSLFAVVAIALLPTFAIAAPAAMTAKPAVVHTQTVKTVKTKHIVRHHHALKKAKMTIKAKIAPAKKV